MKLNTFFGSLFIFLGLTLGCYTFSRTHDKVASRSWPTTLAQIVSSKMYKASSRSNNDWCVILRYRYIIGGKTYSSAQLSTSKISEVGCHQDRRVIAARIEKMQPGHPLKIRYNPREPAHAVVYVADLDILDYLFPLMAMLLIIGGAAHFLPARDRE
jgi:hypothetical protein